MDWVWKIYEPYVRKQLERSGTSEPTEEELQAAFLDLLSSSTVTVLVQEPWQNSVRFKGLERAAVIDRMDLIRDPMAYLAERYGGGKFKLNFHQDWQFIATQNFKPTGDPKWTDLPDVEF